MAVAQADDCPAHDPFAALTDPAYARQLPEQLRSRIPQSLRTQGEETAARRLDPQLSPVPPDAFWWSGFGLPILNGPVHASIVFEGALIVAGEFTLAAGQRVNAIARWDGTAWSPLGAGFDGTVYSLGVYDGRLIAGGAFTKSGAAPTGSLAQWDGTSWSLLGETFYGCVHAFTTHNGKLVAGGCFTNGLDVHTVAEWNGIEWRQVGQEIYGTVLALATYQNEIVAGGSNLPTYPEVSAIVRYDGTAWQPLGTGVSADYSTSVDALAVFQGELIAGGWFHRAGDAAVLSIARWNGARWDSLGGSPSGVYDAFMVDGDELVAAGGLHDGHNSVSIARWNGTSWSKPADPLHGVRTLTKYQGSLIAGGYFQEAWPEDQEFRPLPWIGRLEGTRWQSFESWTSKSRGLFVSGGANDFLEYQGRLVVAGDFQYAGSDGGWTPFHGIAQWDGVSWSPIAALNGYGYGYFYTLENFEGDLIVGGNFYMPDASASGAARWNGSQWSPMGNVGPLRALAVYRGELYGAGYFWNEGRTSGEEGVARWDGNQWQIVGGGFPFVPFETWVTALVVYHDVLIAAGRFEQAGSVNAKNIAAWDGTSWQPVGTGREFDVQSLAVFKDELLAGGAGPGRGMPSALGRWHGWAWEDIDIAGCTFVNALYATDRQLFVGGQFSEVNGVQARNVAAWNGKEWSALGSGVDARPSGFGEYGGSLYVGGWFTEAGGKPSFGIARWDRLESSPVPVPKPTLQASPNPFNAQTEIEYTLGSPARVLVEIFDVRGRRVDTVLDQFEGAGPGSVTWQPSAGVKPGLYFARISAGGSESVARIAYTP